jgi:hypothetical protein
MINSNCDFYWFLAHPLQSQLFTDSKYRALCYRLLVCHVVRLLNRLILAKIGTSTFESFLANLKHRVFEQVGVEEPFFFVDHLDRTSFRAPLLKLDKFEHQK